MKMALPLLLLLAAAACAQTLSPLLTPARVALSGAMVALADEPSGALFNPAGLRVARSMGVEESFGTVTNRGTDRLLVAVANPNSEEGARFASGLMIEGQTRPGPWKFYVPYVASAWQPMARLSFGATLRVLYQSPRNDSLDARWSEALDMGIMTAGKNLNMALFVERALGGSSAVPKTLATGAALKSDNGRTTLSYQWSGDLLSGISYRYRSSALGVEYQTGPRALVRAGYLWSDVHRVSAGLALGLLNKGGRMQAGWSVPIEGGKNTEWSLGLSYRI